MLPVYRHETARPGGADNGILAVLGGDKHSAQMDDGDGYFDLENLEYASDFRAPTNHVWRSCCHDAEGFGWTGPGLGAVPFAVGFAGKPDAGS